MYILLLYSRIITTHKIFREIIQWEIIDQFPMSKGKVHETTQNFKERKLIRQSVILKVRINLRITSVTSKTKTNHKKTWRVEVLFPKKQGIIWCSNQKRTVPTNKWNYRCRVQRTQKTKNISLTFYLKMKKKSLQSKW